MVDVTGHDELRSNIRNCSEREHGIFSGNCANHTMGDLLTKRGQPAGQRQAKLRMLADNFPHTIVGIFEVKGKSVGWTKQGGVVDTNFAIARSIANQDAGRFRAPICGKIRWSKVSLHPAKRGLACSHQVDANGTVRFFANIIRIQIPESDSDLPKDFEGHGDAKGTRCTTLSSCLHSIPTPILSAGTSDEKYFRMVWLVG